MRFSIFWFILSLAFQTHAQVLDVNGDQTVGAEEAIAVAEEWKGPASASDEHDHLGQSWSGDRIPLRISGTFPRRIIIGPVKGQTIGADRAPLMLENTASTGHGLIVNSEGVGASISGSEADLTLGGFTATLESVEPDSLLKLMARGTIQIQFDEDDNGGDILNFVGSRRSVGFINSDGELTMIGGVTKSVDLTKIDNPLNPANKYLVHSSVESPEMKNVYDGIVTLDDNGEATVQLPDYFEALNADFRYQLTCIGGFAPVYVSEKIQANQFKIAGGNPGQEVSWQVTGIRNDAYAKSHPIEVEQKKTPKEKGKYLHPELFGEPVEKGIGFSQNREE